MSKNLKIILTLGIIFFVLFLFRPFLIVSEGEQVVLTRFGRIVQVHKDAGLKLKIPLIDQVRRYSKKILSWDGAPQRLPTREKLFILVDATARWRISEPRIFYQRVNTMDEAYARLDDVIESAVRTVVSQYPIAESVRSSNDILDSENLLLDFQQNDLPTETENQGSVEDQNVLGSENTTFSFIELGRKVLSREMLTRAQESMPEFGIELLDVVLRQIRYSDDLTRSVYDRMITERAKIATGYRSDGNGKKAEWLGRLNRDRDIKLSEANRDAARIRAEGNANAAQIYATAYGIDPEFYHFWKALESYRITLPKQQKVLSTSMNFFDYLYEIQ